MTLLDGQRKVRSHQSVYYKIMLSQVKASYGVLRAIHFIRDPYHHILLGIWTPVVHIASNVCLACYQNIGKYSDLAVKSGSLFGARKKGSIGPLSSDLCKLFFVNQLIGEHSIKHPAAILPMVFCEGWWDCQFI